ncbi:hypothetical protein [Shimia sp. SDUM112013]
MRLPVLKYGKYGRQTGWQNGDFGQNPARVQKTVQKTAFAKVS